MDQGFGGEVWLFEICKALGKVHDITILTSDNGSRQVSFTEILKSEFHIRIFEIHRETSNHSESNLVNELGEFDAIYLMDTPFSSSQTKSFLSNYLKAKTIKGNHTPLSVSSNLPKLPLYIRIYYKFWKPLLLRNFRKFNVQHVLNKADLEYMNSRKLNAKLIYNGVHLNKYTKMDKNSKFTIAIVGNLSYMKGVDRLDKILRKLTMPTSSFEILIVGDGPLRSKLKHLNTSVELLGFVSEPKKMEIMSKAHLLLSLSRVEAFPFTVIEALASHTPVVAFDITGVNDIIVTGYNGYLAKSCDEIANFINSTYAIYNTERYVELCTNARQSVEKLSWENILPEILGLFEGK